MKNNKGVVGYLLYSPITHKHIFRVYDEDYKFIDYDICAEDIKIQIVDDQIEFDRSYDKNRIVRYRRVPKIVHPPKSIGFKIEDGLYKKFIDIITESEWSKTNNAINWELCFKYGTKNIIEFDWPDNDAYVLYITLIDSYISLEWLEKQLKRFNIAEWIENYSERVDSKYRALLQWVKS